MLATISARRPRDRNEIIARFPRLVRALKWSACLCDTEAACTIRDRRDGQTHGCEAVNHVGRYGDPDPVKTVLAHAFRCRSVARRYG